MSLTGACKYATYGNNAVWLNHRILHIYTIMPNVHVFESDLQYNIIYTIIQYANNRKEKYRCRVLHTNVMW